MPVEQEKLKELSQKLPLCETRKRFGFSQQLKKLSHQPKQKSDSNSHKKLINLAHEINQSCERVAIRRSQVPKFDFPESLPISERKAEIIAAIENNQVVIIAGETGSGKTTQIPKMCLAAGLGITGTVGHTQPRRLAARSVAQRIADELQCDLGEFVGYKIRFQDRLSEQTQIKLLTDGMLLAEIASDRFLQRYDVIIIDEAHERSLNIDFLLGYFKRLLPRRPDLKLIVTSATIDHWRFSRYFNDAPVIEVSGRTYPVTTEYLTLEQPPNPEEDSVADDEAELESKILMALQHIDNLERNNTNPARPRDILIFLAGERDIRQIADCIRRRGPKPLEILPLYSRLSNTEQNKVFQTGSSRRVVLATNVAETSITVPNIGYVIDPGLARISRYNYRTKVQRLPIEPISQASANQRAGRCGRVAEGVCIRLYSQADFEERPQFSEPELLRTNLASVILQMRGLGIGEPEKFPFIDPPDNRLLNDGYRLLEELQAIDARKNLTPTGKLLLKFPVDPRLGRMLVAAKEFHCLRELLIVASGLAVPEPWMRPHGQQPAADSALKKFQEERSDFLTYVETWQQIEANKTQLTNKGYRKWLLGSFLSYLRVREWQDLYRQLKQVCVELGWEENKEPARYEEIHKAILSGLLDQVAVKEEKKVYKTTRNRQFHCFPGTALKPGSGKWVVAAEIVETSRVFGRTLAAIEPQWVEALANHLLKRSYSEPHWEKKRACVIAYEQSSLFGLIVNPRKRVNFSAIDPVKSREIFIYNALVLNDYDTRAPYAQHNKKLIQELEYLEQKVRRRDILIDDETLFAWFDAKIPKTIVNGKSFEQWRKRVETHEPRYLFLTEADLTQSIENVTTETQYPDQVKLQGAKLKIDYQFDPGKTHDGINIEVPITMLNQINAAKLEWLVPGLERDKCIALIKSLPKSTRKQFVPVPDYVDEFLASNPDREKSLKTQLVAYLKQKKAVQLNESDFEDSSIADFLKANIRVYDTDKRLIAEGRNVEAILLKCQSKFKTAIHTMAEQNLSAQLHRDWDFGVLDRVTTIRQGGVEVQVYPALSDCGDGIRLQYCDSEFSARNAMESGLLRLFMLTQAKQVRYVKQHYALSERSQLYYSAFGNAKQLAQGLVHQIFYEAYVFDDLSVRSAEAFIARSQLGNQRLATAGATIQALLEDLLAWYHKVSVMLVEDQSPAKIKARQDIEHQLSELFPENWLVNTPLRRLQQYPRYLKAIDIRWQRLQGKIERDAQYVDELQELWQQYTQRRQQHAETGKQNEALEEWRWALEEYRISLFAQGMKTLFPISETRLAALWQAVPP